MKNDQKKRVYAFIDSQNLNMGTQKFGWKMDWQKFRKFLTSEYGVSKAFMFIGYVPEFNEMYEFLHEVGYAIVLKPTFDISRPRPEASGESEEDKKPVKGNTDADMVLWVMKEWQNYDQAVIVSGDGDFYSLVEYLDQKSRLAKILAPNAHYSRLFSPYEKYVERLDKFRRQLAYRDKKHWRKS